MKKQRFLAVACAMAIAAGTVGTSAFVSVAAPYTQADTPSQVTYGTLTQQELEIVYKYFDAAYYASKYDDVVEALGTDEALLLEHFVKCGIFEGREGWPTFNASAYASAYPELKDLFGRDIVKYFVHYYTKGINEGRDITTIAACEKAGIKVISLFDEDDFVSTEIYAASRLLGTNDYATVQKAANSAANNGAAIVNLPKTETKSTEVSTTETSTTEETPVVSETEENSGESVIIATEEVAEKLAKNDPNYQVAGTISLSDDREVMILVYKNASGSGYSSKFYNDIQDVITDTEINQQGIVGFIPAVIFTAQEANALCEGEEYDIETFDIKEGNIIGTEGVVFPTDNNIENAEYLKPTEFKSNHQRTMTNYVNGIYMDNAQVGGDENGTADTEYEVGTITSEDENGNAVVTTVISNDETGFNYEVTYTFDGNPYGFVQPNEKQLDNSAE